MSSGNVFLEQEVDKEVGMFEVPSSGWSLRYGVRDDADENMTEQTERQNHRDSEMIEIVSPDSRHWLRFSDMLFYPMHGIGK